MRVVGEREASRRMCDHAASDMLGVNSILHECMRKRRGSGDPPGLQNRREAPSRRLWCVRLAHASANVFKNLPLQYLRIGLLHSGNMLIGLLIGITSVVPLLHFF